MRTCGSVFVCTKRTLADFAQAFMCPRIRVLSAAGALSRNATVNRTLPAFQYLVVRTARRIASGAKPGITRTNRSMGGWLTGLIERAFAAASTQRFCGSCFGVQQMGGFMVPLPLERDRAAGTWRN